MLTILEALTEKVSAAFAVCGFDAKLGEVTLSKRPDLCDFQCSGSFAAARLYRKNPAKIAEVVCAALQDEKVFRSCEAVNGFINLTLCDSFLMQYVSEMLSDEHLGIPQAEKPERIVLDYGGPNVAKPLHIGHLRSAVIGEALKRIVKASGREAIADVHLGDWGLQIGLVIAELEVRFPNWPCFAADFDAEKNPVETLSQEQLNEIYPYASAKSKRDGVFLHRAQQVTAALQGGHPGHLALWREIIRVSVQDIRENYEKLRVSFDLWNGESDAEPWVPKLIQTLEQRNMLRESDGALVADVALETDTAPVPPVIIKKSDNSNIYATTDLATIMQRTQELVPDQIWYIVDSRQNLHFTQVFRCARKAALVSPETELEHLGFGTINGADGKPFKTREGGVMRLADFFAQVYQAAYARTGVSVAMREDERAETAEKIAAAAIKFGDLINHRSKDYCFDPDKFLAAEGKTGPFLLYTVARINSVLRKCAGRDTVPDGPYGIYSEEERELLILLALSGEVFRRSFRERAPNHICEHAYQISSAFSTFYHAHHIAGEQNAEKQRAWLGLCAAVLTVLRRLLDVLGIDTVEAM